MAASAGWAWPSSCGSNSRASWPVRRVRCVCEPWVIETPPYKQYGRTMEYLHMCVPYTCKNIHMHTLYIHIYIQRHTEKGKREKSQVLNLTLAFFSCLLFSCSVCAGTVTWGSGRPFRERNKPVQALVQALASLNDRASRPKALCGRLSCVGDCLAPEPCTFPPLACSAGGLRSLRTRNRTILQLWQLLCPN